MFAGQLPYIYLILSAVSSDTLFLAIKCLIAERFTFIYTAFTASVEINSRETSSHSLCTSDEPNAWTKEASFWSRLFSTLLKSSHCRFTNTSKQNNKRHIPVISGMFMFYKIRACEYAVNTVFTPIRSPFMIAGLLISCGASSNMCPISHIVCSSLKKSIPFFVLRIVSWTQLFPNKKTSLFYEILISRTTYIFLFVHTF